MEMTGMLVSFTGRNCRIWSQRYRFELCVKKFRLRFFGVWSALGTNEGRAVPRLVSFRDVIPIF